MLRLVLAGVLAWLAGPCPAQAQLFDPRPPGPIDERPETPASKPSLSGAVITADAVAFGLGAASVVSFAVCMSHTVGDYADDDHPACALMALTGLAAVGTYALGAPIIHARRGSGAAMTSLALRAGLPILGGFAMSDEPVAGILVGFGAAMIIDWTFLCGPQQTATAAIAPTVVPMRDGAALALAGQF